MGTVVMYGTVSVDGFIADVEDQPGSLFDWLTSGDVPLDDTGQLTVSQASYDHTRAYWDQVGVTIAGRHVFDMTDGWGGTPPSGVDHVVVVSHRPPLGSLAFHVIVWACGRRRELRQPDDRQVPFTMEAMAADLGRRRGEDERARQARRPAADIYDRGIRGQPEDADHLERHPRRGLVSADAGGSASLEHRIPVGTRLDAEGHVSPPGRAGPQEVLGKRFDLTCVRLSV